MTGTADVHQQYVEEVARDGSRVRFKVQDHPHVDYLVLLKRKGT